MLNVRISTQGLPAGRRILMNRGLVLDKFHDEYLIDLARAAGADALVSGDAHLLDLRGVVPVMTPAQFLATLATLATLASG